MRLFILLIALTFITACSGEPRLDTSSPERMQASTEALRNSLPENERDAFDEDFMLVAMEKADLGALLLQLFLGDFSDDEVPEELFRQLPEELNGLSAADIREQAAELREQQRQRQLAQVLQEIEELENKLRHAEQMRASLAAVEVSRSRFFKRDDGFSTRPIIELTVKNNTEHAISRAYFRGTYQTPGRSVPWLTDTFNYQISGGLEPGETQSWSLAPNMFGDWGRLEVRDDAVFTVETIRIDGPDGEPVYDARGLDEFEERRLRRLREQLENLE